MTARARTKTKNKTTNAGNDSKTKNRPAQPWFFEQPEPIVRFTGWVALFAALSLVVSALQWCTLQQTNRISQATFRPKLMLVNKNADPEFAPVPGSLGEKGLGWLSWTWEFSNFGQGMATDVAIDSFIKLEDGPFQYTFGQQGPSVGGGAMPPGATNFATISSEPMVKSYGEGLLKQDLGVSFLIIFKYKDEIGNAYETEICVSHLQNGAMPYLDPRECKKQIEARPQ